MNRFTIRARLYAMVFVLLGALVGSASYAIYSMSHIGVELVAIAEQDIPLARVITNITVHQLEQSLRFEQGLRHGEHLDDGENGALLKQSLSEFKKLNAQVDEELLSGERIAREALAAAHTQAEADEFRHVLEQLELIKAEHADYAEHALLTLDGLSQGETRLYKDNLHQVEAEEQHLNHALEELLTEINAFTAEAALESEHHEQEAQHTLLLITLVAGVGALLLAVGTTRSIGTGIELALSGLERIAQKDLSRELRGQDRGDEIGRMLASGERMRLALMSSMETIQASTSEIAALTEQMARTSEESSHSLEEANSQLSHSSESMTELVGATQEVARNATLTVDQVISAEQAVAGGRTGVEKTIAEIGALARDVERSARAVQNLAEESEAITSVLDVIKSVAEQTNLLALNASIEAARAGEHGRGFAVVADEVRTLASRTHQSTGEIEEMISRLRQGTREAVETMENGQRQAGISVDTAARAGDNFALISEAITNISRMNDLIAAASQQQSTSAEEIDNSLAGLTEASRVNAEIATEAASAGQELANLSERLHQLAAGFKLQQVK